MMLYLGLCLVKNSTMFSKYIETKSKITDIWCKEEEIKSYKQNLTLQMNFYKK